MYTLGTHFDEMFKKLLPPQERLDAARDLPPLVRDYLKAHEEFETLAPHSRLAGSYAQHLSVGDVKDVDFLVRVPGDPEENEPGAKELVQALKKALDGLPEALELEGYADIDITRARRSVHVHFVDRDFHLDVVPCVAPDGLDELLWVPDRGYDEWIRSHPIGYVNLIAELVEEYGEKVRGLIKALKHFRNHQMKTRKPKSYWLGAMAVYHIRRDGGLDMDQPLAVLVRDLLDAIYQQYESLYLSEKGTPNIPDPMLGHNISPKWERSHFETFMRRLDDARGWATTALETDDRDKAIELWQRIFGEEYFPTEVKEAALAAARAGLPGLTGVGAGGLVTPHKPSTGIWTPTQKTTFHGEREG